MGGAELTLQVPDRFGCLVVMNTYLGPEPERSRRQYFALTDQIEAIEGVPGPLLDAIVPLYFRSALIRRRLCRRDLDDPWPVLGETPARERDLHRPHDLRPPRPARSPA
jgi:hypothetical protein